jgi:hypothetical protein
MDEAIKVAVEDPLRVPDLVTRAQVLHLLVRVEHVASDLTSEVGLLHGATLFCELRLALLRLTLGEA